MRAPARRRPPAAASVLVLAVLALVTTVLARPPHAPPLYDGIGFPDEPYRWVVTPPGHYQTPLAATAAAARVSVSGAANVAGQALSGEQGPQIAVAVSRGAFSVPAGVSSITLRAVPQAVPAVLPEQGQVVSNLYLLTAEASGTPVPLTPGRTILVNMRAERPTPQAVVICRWTGQQWEQLPTTRVGADIYAAQLDALAPVAVIRLDPGVTPSVSAHAGRSNANPGVPAQGAGAGATTGSVSAAASGGPGANALWLVIGLVVVALAGLLLIVRRWTARPTEADNPAEAAGSIGRDSRARNR
jgi:hypothetical protein